MDEYPSPATIKSTKTILEQMNNCLYKIETNKGKSGITIFSYIKYLNKQIPILITNYEIINEEYLANNTNINISKNNELTTINFGDTKYLNKELDLAVVEIKVNENKKIYFLEPDECLYENDAEINFNRQTIYIINYKNENDITVSYGKIHSINDKEINYLSCRNLFNYCFPIFNLDNNKLIGFCMNRSSFYNKGIFSKFLINEFIKEYRINIKNKENNIDIFVNINKKDINKKIYFLNYFVYERNDKLLFLNEYNTELHIDNKKIKFEKFFIPEKERIYTINLKFSINLTDCSYMFAGCENIEKIQFNSFKTQNVTNMKYMFHRCKNLKEINLFSIVTRNVTDMHDMFSFCENLVNLDLTSFDTKNVINMDYMFYNCNKLTNLDISSFNTTNITTTDFIFDLCPNLKIDSNSLVSKEDKFVNKYKNEILIFININEENINKEVYFLDNYEYTDNEGIKHYHDNLDELNEYNTKIKINKKKLKYQKFFIPKKKGIFTIKLKFKVNLINCSYMFAGCENIENIIFYNFNSEYITNMKKMFYDCNSISRINLESFKTKNVLDMNNMFNGCNKLLSLEIKNFNTKNVTNMSGMFSYCNNLSNIKFSSSFDTSNVENMSDMFSYCTNLENINLSSFKTTKVTNMSCMFKFCENLKELDLSSFNTSNVTNMGNMFSDCVNLVNLNLSNFDTQNVTSMRAMFSNCKQLNNLDLNSFDNKNVKDVTGIFFECPKEIIDFNISKFKHFNHDDLFKYC